MRVPSCEHERPHRAMAFGGDESAFTGDGDMVILESRVTRSEDVNSVNMPLRGSKREFCFDFRKQPIDGSVTLVGLIHSFTLFLVLLVGIWGS